ncbi:MAG: coproporphyrinogen dehydrogenase HemZ [Clostridiales bacterium]|nr:coproporphyrinogen dehydrogenase HemZ [Clostridiales bacterium]
MIVNITGNTNRNYVENLCLIFFPGSKFAKDEIYTEETPVLELLVEEDDEWVRAKASMKIGEQSASGSGERRLTVQMANKKAVGEAVLEAGRRLCGYQPAWGFLTGIRPAKIASDMLAEGCDAATVRRRLRNEYFLIPKKAALLTNIAVNEQNIIASLAENSCSVYISIPFCPTRCAYCSFVSYSTKRLLSMIPDYIERLVRDIDDTFAMIQKLGKKVVTVYIGGGTPTTLSADELSILLSAVERNVDVGQLLEYTVEAGRPDTVTAEKMSVLLAHGVTRVSINPQTFNEAVLDRIGRCHTVEDFYRAYDIARNSGVKYINADLIAGLPGEGFRTFAKSVDAILALRPDNITYHTFCVKKAADILRSNADIYSRTGGDTFKSVDYTQLKSKAAGYIPYYIYRQKNSMGNLENVGFALPGAEGLYNIFIIEEVHSIFAIGAGASTKMVGGGKIKRAFMPKYPYEYLAMSEEAITSYYEKIDEFFTENG